MKLLGNRLFIRPVKKGETESGLVIPDSASDVKQLYTITHIGDGVEDERFGEGKQVMVSDAVVNRSQEFTINEKAYRLITPDNVVAFP